MQQHQLLGTTAGNMAKAVRMEAFESQQRAVAAAALDIAQVLAVCFAVCLALCLVSSPAFSSVVCVKRPLLMLVCPAQDTRTMAAASMQGLRTKLGALETVLLQRERRATDGSFSNLEKERRVALATRMVKRMLRQHLSRAWLHFLNSVFTHRKNRTAVWRVLAKMRARSLTLVWRLLVDHAALSSKQRGILNKVVARWQRLLQMCAWEEWCAALEERRESLHFEARLVAQQASAGSCANCKTLSSECERLREQVEDIEIYLASLEDEMGSCESLAHSHVVAHATPAATPYKAPTGGAVGGYVGLIVSDSPPHKVVGVQDLVDVHFVRHDEAHYANPHIAPGDRIISVDGKHAEDVSVDVLHSMLAGPLHSAVNITLARPHTGQKYSVVVLRHSYGAFDRHGRKQSEHVMEQGGHDSVTMSPAKAALVPRTPGVAPGELVTRFTRPSPFREATEAEQKEIFVAADITPGVGMSRPRALLVPTQSIARHQTGPHHLNY